MEWRDTGTVIGVRPHGETAVVLELMTAAHGRHSGLVHGGRSRKRQPILQLGNTLEAHWRGRLDEHLGTYTVEPADLRAGALMASAVSLYGAQAAAMLLRLLPEREAHPALAAGLGVLLDALGNASDPGSASVAAALMVRFEAQVLHELGYGLDLTRCAVSGETDHLTHVSPRTGRAVGEAAALPYRDRLLELPEFLRPDRRSDSNRAGSTDDLKAGFALTGHFLDRYRAEVGLLPVPDGAIDPRAAFIEAATRAMAHPA